MPAAYFFRNFADFFAQNRPLHLLFFAVKTFSDSTKYGKADRIWHQKEDRVLSHILVCFLAYVLWKTLGQMVKASGLGDEPHRVLEELSKINLVDVVLPTSSGLEIRERCITRPNIRKFYSNASI